MKYIIIYDGGFGIFNSIFKILEINEKSNCIIFVLYNPCRHNKFLGEFVSYKTYWINTLLFDFFFRKYSLTVKRLFAKLLKKILKFFSKEVYLINEYLNYYFKTNTSIFGSKDKSVWPDYLVHHKFLISNNYIKTEVPKIKLPSYIPKKNYYKTINLKIKKATSGIESIYRNSSNIQEYSLVIKNLVEMDCFVFISGEIDVKILNYQNIFKHKNIKINEKKDRKLDIYAYLNSDCTIGPHSGSTNFNTIHYKPQLILDAYPIGHSWLNSTMAYKMVETNQTKFKQLLGRTRFPIKENLKVRNCNGFEINEIVLNYINNFNYNFVYGLSSEDLKIKEICHFSLTGSKISDKWYELNKKILKD